MKRDAAEMTPLMPPFPYTSQVFDYDRDDSVEKIGHVDTTLALMSAPNWTGKLLHPKGKNKDVGTIMGTAIVSPRARALARMPHATLLSKAPSA